MPYKAAQACKQVKALLISLLDLIISTEERTTNNSGLFYVEGEFFWT